MLTQIRSVFLLMLFMLVILFPGYSQGVGKKADMRRAQLSTTEHTAGLEAMFRKCLSCGISNNAGPVNEEAPSSSSSEERADHGVQSPIDEFAITGNHIYVHEQSVVLWFMYERQMPPHAITDIPTPPPDLSL
jgi:hypothetical protein